LRRPAVDHYNRGHKKFRDGRPIEDIVPPLALAFLVTWIACRGLLRSRAASRVLDQPNARSLHDRPVPRLGGIAMTIGVAAAAAWIGAFPAWLAIALALALVSFADDVRSLPVAARLAAHFGAALAMLASLPITVSWPLAACFVLGMAWMTNLYNFMDGSDGLAGGMALIGFGCYGAAAWMGGEYALALPVLSVAATALAFLAFNFPPARIFLGDAGSIPLGFLAAAVGILGWRVHALWPWWFPAVVFSPFAVDATVTLARRAARREPVWRAHRDHYYQRLVRMGWSHRRTALAEYALMLACALIALALREAEPRVQRLALWGLAAAYVVIMALIDRAWRRKQAGAAGA
jgi:UDP-N-acetylmuramyl pentapeptide phosphotransferase/UDP-N-acetylglucosamine-1-phosphate transferase